MSQFGRPMTYGDAEHRLTEMAKRIRNVEKGYAQAVEDAATAEALYRRKLGERFRELRAEGLAVEAAMTQARGELFNLSRERDIASGRVRGKLDELEDRRGERASLHKLVDWSGGIDVIERRGNGRTPYADSES
jgi:chromosome segregation ATPase